MFGRRKKTDDYTLPTLTVYGESILKARSQEYDRNCVYLSAKQKREGEHSIIKFRSAVSGRDIYLPLKFSDNLPESYFIIPAWLQRNLHVKTGEKLAPTVMSSENAGVEVATGFKFTVRMVDGRDYFDALDVDRVIKSLRKSLEGKTLANAQYIALQLDRKLIELQVSSVLLRSGRLEEGKHCLATFDNNALVEVANASPDILDFEMVELDQMVQDAFEIPMDFAQLGVGGHKQIIKDLIRRVFYTRVLSKEALDAFGVEKHGKGVLLYGPPGTGKTLIASTIAELLPSSQFVKVNGPEVMSSYVGASQGNIGKIFEVAKQNPSKLYIFFFDELEAISRERQGQGGTSTQVGNEMVSRLLTELDGAKSADNVVFIGATNRKDLIDPAILRAGRLDAKFYVGLPSLEDRLEILQIHTRNITARANDWDLRLIAQQTEYYSGAELAKLVDVARSYALRENIDPSLDTLKMKDVRSVTDLAPITQAHFLLALKEVKPDFGVKEVFTTRPDKFAPDNPTQEAIVADFNVSMSSFMQGSPGQFNYMISGASCSGKTSIAEYLAFHSGIKHVQIVDVAKMIAMTEIEQRRYLAGVFAKTRESIEPSIVILDGIEDILNADPEHKQYNNGLRIQLNALLKPDAGRNNKLIVIGCCQDREFLNRVGLGRYFYSPAKLHLSNNSSETATLGKVVSKDSVESSRGVAASLFRPN